jgi:excisionase family DNA binding protein
MNLYTVKQAAAIVGCSTNTLYKYLNEGRIKANRGTVEQGRFRIPQSSLEEFLGAPLNSPQNSPHPAFSLGSRAGLPLKLVRTLIVSSLLLIMIDIVVTQSVSTTTQLSRLFFVAIALLLAYQEGGFVRR